MQGDAFNDQPTAGTGELCGPVRLPHRLELGKERTRLRQRPQDGFKLFAKADGRTLFAPESAWFLPGAEATECLNPRRTVASVLRRLEILQKEGVVLDDAGDSVTGMLEQGVPDCKDVDVRRNRS